MSPTHVLLGATITLSAGLVGALTAFIIVLVKRQEENPARPLSFSGGERVALVVNEVGVPKTTKLPTGLHWRGDKFVVRTGEQSMSGPPGWKVLQVPPSMSHFAVKWLLPFALRGYATVVVTDNDKRSVRLARKYVGGGRTSTSAPIEYRRPIGTQPLLQFANALATPVGQQWAAFLRENVHPAWWVNLLVPDLRVVVHNQSVHSADAYARCALMLKLMQAHKLPADTWIFSYLFSPLTKLAATFA